MFGIFVLGWFFKYQIVNTGVEYMNINEESETKVVGSITQFLAITLLVIWKILCIGMEDWEASFWCQNWREEFSKAV